MISASYTLQRALYATLTAYPPLMASVTGIFDHAPDAQHHPFVTLGDDIVTDWSQKDRMGREHRLTFHVWSQAPGQSQAKAILGLIEEALDHAPVDLGDYSLVSLRFLAARVFLEPDAGLHHGVLEFRARTVAY